MFLHLNNFICGGISKISYILKSSTKYYFVLTLKRCISYKIKIYTIRQYCYIFILHNIIKGLKRQAKKLNIYKTPYN